MSGLKHSNFVRFQLIDCIFIQLKIDPNKYLLENIEHEKDISRLGVRHYFETDKDPINVAQQLKLW